MIVTWTILTTMVIGIWGMKGGSSSLNPKTWLGSQVLTMGQERTGSRNGQPVKYMSKMSPWNCSKDWVDQMAGNKRLGLENHWI